MQQQNYLSTFSATWPQHYGIQKVAQVLLHKAHIQYHDAFLYKLLCVFSYILLDVKTHEFGDLFRFGAIAEFYLEGGIDYLKVTATNSPQGPRMTQMFFVSCFC